MDTEPIAGLAFLAALVVASVMGPRWVARCWFALVAAARRLPRVPRRVEPAGRPIELIARDVHRLGGRFRCAPVGVSFARFEGRRLAYDRVLVEACDALGIEHLLRVLPPGVELDSERQRVEDSLDRAGLRLDGST